MERGTYEKYVKILRHELVPALGCTEPIAIAFAAAKVREVLGCFPQHLTAFLSGNIIKNVKSVVVPNSGGERGIEIAAALGCVGGDTTMNYEVLAPVTQQDIERAKALVGNGFCSVRYAVNEDNLYIHMEAECDQQTAGVTVEFEHTHISEIVKNGQIIYQDKTGFTAGGENTQKDILSVRGIVEFAKELIIEDVQSLLEKEIRLNTAISEEGLRGCYGEAVGQTLMELYGDKVESRAAARAAAGSDARMNGCSMPVVINSGSGNQGMTVTLPICEYAKSWGKDEDTMLRALALSNLISIHIKRHIGNLSAFCGAVSAACGAACGIAWMDGCSYEQICMTITNTLCTVGGMVCDGAKSSCAAKIASAVNAATLSYRMAKNGRAFQPGEGLVGKDIEETIENIGRMGRKGMQATDVEILHIMVGSQ